MEESLDPRHHTHLHADQVGQQFLQLAQALVDARSSLPLDERLWHLTGRQEQDNIKMRMSGVYWTNLYVLLLASTTTSKTGRDTSHGRQVASESVREVSLLGKVLLLPLLLLLLLRNGPKGEEDKATAKSGHVLRPHLSSKFLGSRHSPDP